MGSFERTVAVFLMMFCGAVYAYVVGEICGVLGNNDPATQKYQSTMDLMKIFSTEAKLEHGLKMSISNYFEHCDSLFRNRYYQQHITHMMSPELQKEVSFYIYGRLFKNIDFLYDIDSEKEKELLVTQIAL